MKTICSCVLFLAALLFAIPAHADTTDLTITGQTNFAACASINMQCANVSFALNFVTELDPFVLAPGPLLDVESISGTANGEAVNGSGGVLQIPANYLPYSFMPVTIGGVPSDITFNFINNFVDFDGALVDWNVNVATPEPPSCLLLLLALPLLLKYRNRSLRGSCDA